VKKEAKLSARYLEYSKVTANRNYRIYDVKVCLLFARGAWDCQRMTRQGWSIVSFGCENDVVVLVAQRLE